MPINKLFLPILVAVSLPVLQGCVVAATPAVASALAWGGIGFGGYQIFRLTRGGSVNVAIDGPGPDRAVLEQMADLRRPAVWPTPGSGGAVTFTETLETMGDYRPVPPSRVAAVLDAQNIAVDLNDLTTRERVTAFNVTCREFDADSVVASAFQETATEMRLWTGPRATIDMTVRIFYHSCIEQELIFTETLSILVEVGRTAVDERAIARDAGEVLAARFDGLVRGRTTMASVGSDAPLRIAAVD